MVILNSLATGIGVALGAAFLTDNLTKGKYKQLNNIQSLAISALVGTVVVEGLSTYNLLASQSTDQPCSPCAQKKAFPIYNYSNGVIVD